MRNRPATLVESYDPSDVFADLADALAEVFPALAIAELAEPAGDEPAAAHVP